MRKWSNFIAYKKLIIINNELIKNNNKFKLVLIHYNGER